MKKELNLKLKKDISKDVEILIGFLETAEIFDIQEELKIGFYNPYPELKKIIENTNDNKKRDEKINDFVQEIYKKNLEEIEKGVKKTRKQWEEVKIPFSKKVSSIFSGYFWSKNEYLGYSTVWGTYPRFLEKKEFTFPYSHKKDKYALFVIMHEMLHFIFYDYAISKYPKIFKKMDKNRGLFWDLAEIFNVVILFLPDFIKLHGQSDILEGSLHPKHQKHLSYFKELWSDSNEVDKWILDGYNHLKDN